MKLHLLLLASLLTLSYPDNSFAKPRGPAAAEPPAPDPAAGSPIREKSDFDEREFEEERFEWAPTLRQATLFLGIKHAFRMTEPKTRRELKGPLLKDYAASVKGLGGWADGDGIFTNYVAHPAQGASSGFLHIQNDPVGRETEFSRDRDYWRSRLKALRWAALHSAQFELGPVSEAMIGNVGKKKGTMGFVDLVMTPVGGLGWMIGEDLLDRFVVKQLESRTASLPRRRFYRVAFNPTRGFANLLRGRVPWHRDTRPLLDPWFGACHAPGAFHAWRGDLGPGLAGEAVTSERTETASVQENAQVVFTMW
jgi:hypothetical protein